jgi:type II restriction enzyme
MTQLTAQQVFQRLIESGIYDSQGQITMSLNGIDVPIKLNDTVGNSLQEWFSQWLVENDIYFRQPLNTQEYPDFYLSEDNKSNLLEVKSYFGKKGPGFDIANFNSYWNSIINNPWRLDADYLIFSYLMEDGIIRIKKLFLKKVWQITGKAKDYPLKCQIKKGIIYNIRPVSFHSNRPNVIPPFSCKEEFLVGLKNMVLQYTHDATATRNWFNSVITNYQDYSHTNIQDNINNFL